MKPQDSLNTSQSKSEPLNASVILQVTYMENVSKAEPQYRDNLLKMYQFGFADAFKNLSFLKSNGNDLEKAVSHYL